MNSGTNAFLKARRVLRSGLRIPLHGKTGTLSRYALTIHVKALLTHKGAIYFSSPGVGYFDLDLWLVTDIFQVLERHW